jgi:hypothetical protein
MCWSFFSNTTKMVGLKVKEKVRSLLTMTIATLLCSLSEYGDVAKCTINEALVTNLEVISTVHKWITCSSTQSFRTRKLTESSIIVGRSKASVCLAGKAGDINLKQPLLLKEIDVNSFYTRWCIIRACELVRAACKHNSFLCRDRNFNHGFQLLRVWFMKKCLTSHLYS